jgi:hypothetical protein
VGDEDAGLEQREQRAFACEVGPRVAQSRDEVAVAPAPVTPEAVETADDLDAVVRLEQVEAVGDASG